MCAENKQTKNELQSAQFELSKATQELHAENKQTRDELQSAQFELNKTTQELGVAQGESNATIEALQEEAEIKDAVMAVQQNQLQVLRGLFDLCAQLASHHCSLFLPCSY